PPLASWLGGSRLSPGMRFYRRHGALQRQPHGRDRLRGDALAAAGEAEALGRRRLDADPRRRDRENGGDAVDHAGAVRRDFRTLADDRDIDGSDIAAFFANEG